jgi:tryptophan synthase alpha chain
MKGIYLTGGYPDSSTFRECCEAVASSGFNFIEVGIPFNDPIADGPVIAAAIHESLGGGATPASVMKDIEGIQHLKLKKYVMTYANVVYSYGIKRFSDRMAPLLDGVIIPDLSNRMTGLFYDSGFAIPIVPFATLESRESDIEAMNGSPSRIIYFVGVRGITGAQSDFTAPELIDTIGMIRRLTGKQIIIGFGVKSGADARQARAVGDGYVVGTEAVRRQKDPSALREYLGSLV